MRTVAAWTPAILIAAAIYVLSDTRDLHATDGLVELVLRKGAHLAVYGLLTVACRRGLAAHGLLGRRALAGAFVLAVLYAVSDELHQHTVPTRTGTPRDVAIDAAGAAIGLAAMQLTPRLRRFVLRSARPA